APPAWHGRGCGRPGLHLDRRPAAPPRHHALLGMERCVRGVDVQGSASRPVACRAPLRDGDLRSEPRDRRSVAAVGGAFPGRRRPPPRALVRSPRGLVPARVVLALELEGEIRRGRHHARGDLEPRPRGCPSPHPARIGDVGVLRLELREVDESAPRGGSAQPPPVSDSGRHFAKALACGLLSWSLLGLSGGEFIGFWITRLNDIPPLSADGLIIAAWMACCYAAVLAAAGLACSTVGAAVWLAVPPSWARCRYIAVVHATLAALLSAFVVRRFLWTGSTSPLR